MAEEKRSDIIFREQSMNRVNSPEALNDYIRVTTPSVWIVLLALVVLLVGMLAWGALGTVPVESADGTVEEIHPITYVVN